MSLVMQQAPSTPVVTLAEVRAQCRIDHQDQDGLLAGYILAAQEWAEGFTGRKFITQTWDWYADQFPSVIELPLSPLQSVSSIVYTDDTGAQQTLSASLYQVDAQASVPRILPAYGQTWPSTREVLNAVRVRAIVGYGSASNVPEPIRLGVLLYVDALYFGKLRDQLEACRALLWPYRVLSF